MDALVDRAATTPGQDAELDFANLVGLSLKPQDVARAQHRYQIAARAGDTAAMVGLGHLLAYRPDAPDLASAKHWYEQAARAGDADGWYWLGALLARLGDRAGVEQAWRRLIDTSDADVQTVTAAALGLAAFAVLEGLPTMALPLLQVAGLCGSEVAAPCAASLTTDSAARCGALDMLARQHEGQPPALNFLGLAAYRDGAPDHALAFWRRSEGDGDTAAPLLLLSVFGEGIADPAQAVRA